MKQLIASSSTQIFLHPLELRVGPHRFFIVGLDQSSTTMNKLFDQQVDPLISERLLHYKMITELQTQKNTSEVASLE